MGRAMLYVGDAIGILASLPERSVQCCVTSPPYWGLRDYGVDGQLGLESTPEEYVARMVEVFRGVRRVLKDNGTVWLVLGDSCAAAPKGNPQSLSAGLTNRGRAAQRANALDRPVNKITSGLKPKDLIGIPWRVAFALQEDGWWLRSDIIWAKPNPMPESVTDRPTKSHEYVFLLSRSRRYYYNADAIAEAVKYGDHFRNEDIPPDSHVPNAPQHSGLHRSNAKRSGNVEKKYGDAVGRPQGANNVGRSIPWWDKNGKRNVRTVWEIATKPYPGAHFATFPPELAERCIKAGSKPGDVVLDPFGGSGTTAAVAVGHGRDAIHIDLNPEYLELSRKQIGPILCEVR